MIHTELMFTLESIYREVDNFLYLEEESIFTHAF